MKIKYILLPALLTTALVSSAQNVTIKAKDRPAAEVFRSIMEQTDKNFVYSSDLLKDQCRSKKHIAQEDSRKDVSRH